MIRALLLAVLAWASLAGAQATQPIEGQQAHGAALVTKNPVLEGGVGADSAPSAVDDGDAVRAWYDRSGRARVTGDAAMTPLKVEPGAPNTTVKTTAVSCSTTEAQVPGTNLANRRGLLIQADCANTVSVFVIETGDATSAGIELPACASLSLEAGAAVNVFCRTASGTGTVRALEQS